MIEEPAGGQGKPLPGVAHPHHRPTTQYRFRQIDSLYKRRHGPRRLPHGGDGEGPDTQPFELRREAAPSIPSASRNGPPAAGEILRYFSDSLAISRNVGAAIAPPP